MPGSPTRAGCFLVQTIRVTIASERDFFQMKKTLMTVPSFLFNINFSRIPSIYIFSYTAFNILSQKIMFLY